MAEDACDATWDFSPEKLTPAKVSGKWGLINHDGQWVVKPRLDEIKPIPGNTVGTVRLNCKWGLIDRDGQWVVKPKFDGIIRSESCSLVSTYNIVKNSGNVAIRRWVDTTSGTYRTGFNKYIQEPGFHWKVTDGVRRLFNRQGDEIFTAKVMNEAELLERTASGSSCPWQFSSGGCISDHFLIFSF